MPKKKPKKYIKNRDCLKKRPTDRRNQASQQNQTVGI